jgi:putative two-component system response regulator
MSAIPAGEVPRLLVVEDDPGISQLLSQVLQAEGYRVRVADDGLAALAQVAAQPPDLILLDLGLPGLTGDQVCRRLKNDRATRLIPIIILTAQAESQNRLKAWDYGADEFLTKPCQLIEVTARCRSLLRMKQLTEERESAEAVLFALARTVEAKSRYTAGHSERVTRYALALARALHLPEEDTEVLHKGGLLHDIGKISVPDAVLDKPGRLTPEEYDIIKAHAAQGAHIVEPLRSMRAAVPLVRWHHERLDGTGYPDGLSGDAIPHLVRVLSVADFYDSLTSDRPYRGPVPHEQSLHLMRDNALGGGLDPELVAVFANVVKRPLPSATREAALARTHFHDDALCPSAGGA